MDNKITMFLNYSVYNSAIQIEVLNGISEINGTDQNYTYAWQNGELATDNGAVYPSGFSYLRIILTSFFVTVIMILAVLGNMLVCIAIATEKALKNVQNWFIASLAVSDFLVGLIVMPFSLAKEVMGYWIFGRIWCELHSALDVFLCTASINSLCLISLDRYWSVTQAVKYLKKRTPRRSIAMICGVWLLSAIISFPPLVGWKKPEKPSIYPECSLSNNVGYVLYSAFGSFYVPAFVMVFVYCRIFVAVRSRARRHLEKTQKASSSVATKFTNDSLKEKSTTTTTSTSSRNATPQDRSKEFEAFTPVPELPKIPESNVTRSELNVAPIVTVVAPEIIIENSGPVDDLAIDDSVSPSTPQFQLPDNELQRVTFKGDVLQEPNNLCKLASGAKKNTDREKYYLFACEPHTQRTSLLKSPKYLKSPFRSTLAVNAMGKSNEDIIEMGEVGDMKSSGKKKREVKVKTQREEIPIKNTATEAERYKRRIAKAKERRAVLILGLIMASFIFSWLPFFVLYVLRPLCKACEISQTGFAIAFWLGYCNSVINPILYTVFNMDFRKAFGNIIFKKLFSKTVV